MTSYSLISEDLAIPHQKVVQGQTLVIGRNRECRIKKLTCSRSHCTVQVKDNKLWVQYSRTGHSEYVKSGQLIQGPGFSYRVKMGEAFRSQISVKTVKEDSPDMIWSEDSSKKILIGKYQGGGNSSPLIAAFDFDFTLVSPKSGKAFPVNGDDWKLLDPRLPVFISDVINRGYRFVIISNQLGISKGKTDVNEVKKRFNDAVKAIGAPCLVLISTQDNLYRKPRVGLWSYLVETEQPLVSIDFTKSFYVGDAAGRKKSSLQKADHSFVDLYFALNVGLNFMVPEHFVRCAKSLHSSVPNMANSLVHKDCFKPIEPEHDYILLDLSKPDHKVTDLKSVLPLPKHCIIFCGLSASGKSSFYHQHLKPLNYVHISRDELGTQSKCESLAKKAFSEGKNCVIDNTNVERATRAKWIQLCTAINVIPIIFYFKLPLNHIFHNNIFRKLLGKQQNITNVLIYTQNKKLEEPTATECPSGSQVFQVNFVPSFSDVSLKQLYYMYLNEK